MWHELAPKAPKKPVPRKEKKARKTTRAPLVAEWTRDEALERFRQVYADGFLDAQYALQERHWKWSRHELWRDTVSADGFRALVTTSPESAARLIGQMIQSQAPPLQPQSEMVAMRDGVHRPEHAAVYFSTLADLLEAPSLTPEVFESHLQALTSLPLPGSGNLAKWTSVTIIPFLVQPTRHMFLKPSRTKEITRRLGVDIRYSSTPKWETYKRLLDFSNDLLEFLKPHGAKDMIDVQSFIWAITSVDDDPAPA